MFSVFGALFAAVCGAVAVHLAWRRKARTVWSPFGLALLAYAGFLLGSALATCITISDLGHYPVLNHEMLGTVALFLLPLAAVAIGIKRGYACTWAQAGAALLGFCTVAFVAGMLALMFMPCY